MENNAFTESFKNIADFRQSWKIKHKLIEIIFIAVIATIGYKLKLLQKLK